MNLRILWIWSSAVCLGLGGLQAQETKSEVDELKRRLKEAQDNFQKAVDQHHALIDSLNKRLQTLEQRQTAATNTPMPSPAPVPVASAPPNVAPPAVVRPVPGGSEVPAWSASQPIPLLRAGPAYMNISFDTLFDAGWSTAPDPSAELNLGGHDPLQRGFSLPNAEIALDGAVDPYFRAFANIVFFLDKDQETQVELEEAYLQSTALPANLQLKAGQFYANFGRQNPQHPHQWGFVDAPLTLTRAFGPDGLRNPGAQISWLAPTPFYTEAFLGILNGQGGTAFSFRNPGEPDPLGIDRVHGRATTDHGISSPGDLLYTPRLAVSFDLTDQQTLLVGASAAFGANDTGPHERTEIYGGDLYWKWKSARANQGFPFVALQAEGLYQQFEAGADSSAGLPRETLRDWGLYSQVLWGFKPRWVAALRGDWVDGNTGAADATDPFRGWRWRFSPALTWYPSEFSKIRLQYNYDQGELFGEEQSIWLQVEFLLGSHGAHKF